MSTSVFTSFLLPLASSTENGVVAFLGRRFLCTNFWSTKFLEAPESRRIHAGHPLILPLNLKSCSWFSSMWTNSALGGGDGCSSITVTLALGLLLHSRAMCPNFPQL